MEQYVWEMVKITVRFFNHMGPSGWMMTMCLVAGIGMYSMRGFGSRADH